MHKTMAGTPIGGHEAAGDGSLLTPRELEIWNEIVGGEIPKHLGASMLTDTEVAIGDTRWEDEVTLALGIRAVPQLRTAAQTSRPEQVRQMYTGIRQGMQRARDEGAFPATVLEPEVFVRPPTGFRAPAAERGVDQRGLTDADQELLNRVRAGLKRL